MGTRLCTCGLTFALVMCPASAFASSPVWGDCGDGDRGDFVELSDDLRGLVAEGSPEATRCLQQRIGDGLPPAALLVVLDAIALDRPEGLVAVAWDLARHRRPSVRSRALRVLADYGGDWSSRAIILALGDRDPSVRRTGFELAVARPAATYEPALLAAFKRREDGSAVALAACATQALIIQLPGLRSDVETARWVTLVGGLIRRPSLLTPVQRLGLVTTLATLRSPESLDELKQFVRSGVAADEPTARNVAARSLGMRQAPPVEPKEESDPS